MAERRPSPSQTRPHSPVLVLPRHVISLLQHFFEPYARRQVETVALLCGVEGEHASVVTSLAFPDARRGRRHYKLDRASMAKLARELVRSNTVVLAQAHTHPADWVGHSEYDDTHAYSTRDGALSLVWPNYGRGSPPLECVGIHELREGKWEPLSPPQRHTRIHVVEDTFDYRSK